jgi:hypothetical protein
MVLVFLQVILLGPMFLLQQKQWKKHMMREIKQHPESINSREMFFTDPEFSALSWHEGKKEFVLEGEYYDVIQIRSVRGGKLVKCVKDNAEYELVTRYIQSGKGKQNPFHHLLKSTWLKFVMEPHEPLRRLRVAQSLIHEEQRFHYLFSIQESTLKNLSPPPNSV